MTVVGGMGSVPGAFLASLIIGQLQAFGILVFPKITLVLVFLLMAAVLVVKPWGLLGKLGRRGRRAVGHAGRHPLPGALRSPRHGFWPPSPSRRCWRIPLIGDSYTTKVAIEVMVFALAAFSLQFLMGVGGLVSFGHAAYFGMGAYAAGLLATGPLKAPDGGGAPARAARRRRGRRLVRLLRRPTVRHLPRHADARLRPDRLRGLLPMGGGDGRGQRRGRRLAVGLGQQPGGVFLRGGGPHPRRHPVPAPCDLRALRLHPPRRARLRDARRRHRHRRARPIAGSASPWRARRRGSPGRSTPSPRARSTRP